MERGFRWVRRCAAVLVWLALPLFLSGCIFTRFLGVGGNNGTGRSLAVEVKASSVNLVVGSHDVATLTAFVKENGRDLVVDGSEIRWQLSDSSIAQLSASTGRQVTLTALQAGVVSVTASYGSVRSNPVVISVAGPVVLFLETFDNVPDGTNIRNDQSALDNPGSFSRDEMSGTVTVRGGVAELGSQRVAFLVPGLAEAVEPVLRVTIKNDSGSGIPVAGLKLAVGNRYSTGGAVGGDGYRAHGEYPIDHSDFRMVEIPLNTEHTHTGTIQLRGIVGSSSTAGLFIDEIEVVDLLGGSTPGPGDGGPGGGDDGGDQGGGSGSQPPPVPSTPPPPVIDDAYFGLVGYASLNGGVTGGEGPNSRVVFIDNGRDLVDELYANERRHKGDKKYGDPVPLVIYITGKITLANTGVGKIDIKDQKDVSIIGYRDLGELDGVGIKLTRAENVIIRNLTIHHVRNGDTKDGIEIDDSKFIWIDRNTIYNDLVSDVDYYDGLLDIKNGARYITVSWNVFHSNAKGLLVGHTDSDSKPPDKITYHHNHFYNLNTRVPLIRHAEVHMFNNVIQDIVGSGTNVRMGARVRIENNWYENVGSGNRDSHAGYIEGPIGWWYGSPQTGYWEVIGNKFVNNPVNEYQSTTTMAIPYDYSMALNSAERARELVLDYAGAGSPSLDGIWPDWAP